jgi:hypothetical protein
VNLEDVAEVWIAPVADDTGTRTKRYGQGGMALSMQADAWAAPQARDHFPPHSPERIAAMKAEGHGMRNLNDEAAAWAAPAAQNYKGSSEGSITRQDGKSRDDLLHYQAEQFFVPPMASSSEAICRQQLSPGQPTADGSTCSTASPNSNLPSAKRKLNPIFVEALMRWPTGLSGYERQETAWTQWWQLQRSYLSALDWGSGAPAQGGLFDER